MELTDAEQAMLEYVEKLTVAPSSIVEADIEALRSVGWTDRDILDIVQVCAYFNFRVRVVDGLGLKLREPVYDRARRGREQAAALAKLRGVELPPDIWGLTRDLEAAPAQRGVDAGGA